MGLGRWKNEDRFKLHRKIQARLVETPKKPWDLPQYVLDDVKGADLGPLLTWEMKGRRLRRGADRKFVMNPFVDDEAEKLPHFFDAEAKPTSRYESSSGSSSEDDSDSDDSDGEVHVASQEI